MFKSVLRLQRRGAYSINRSGCTGNSKSRKSQDVTLLVNDRLDVVLAAKSQGIKVDGIHVDSGIYR